MVRPLALLLLLLAGAGAAHASLGRRGDRSEAQFAVAQAGGGAATVAAAAAGATAGYAGGRNPSSRRPTNGPRCLYTPAELPRYTDAATLRGTPPLSSCSDAALSWEQQRACRACLAQKSRRGCLSQRAASYYGADAESCTWLDRQGTREVSYALGVNVPFAQSMLLAADTCSLRLEWEREGHSSAYSAAFFEAWMSGWDPSSGAELPRGLRNEIFCVIKGRKQRCSYELARPAGRDFTVFARNIWTEDLSVVRALAQTNTSCLDIPAGPCSSARKPYVYTLRVTEQKCGRRQQLAAVSPSAGQLPFAQPGRVLFPGGQETAVFRDLWLFLEGASRARWTLRFPQRMLVAALTEEAQAAACTSNPDGSLTCDYLSVANRAVPGTLCIGRQCSGSLTKPAGDRLNLVITYPTPFRIPAVETGLVNQRETPTLLVDVLVYRVWP